MSELNIFGLREYYRRDIFEDTTDELREADKFYIMHEADAVIKDITEGAMSMFRESNRCRGLDTKSPLGRIADVAFKHWMYVERLKARLTEKDKEIAELKEFIENYRFDNKNMLHKIMNQDKKIRRLYRALYKACAMWADRTRLICSVFGSNAPKIRWERMYENCLVKARKYK